MSAVLVNEAGQSSDLVSAVVLVAVVLYFLPSIVGVLRHVASPGSIFGINLLFGWVVTGWVIALVMACRATPSSARGERLALVELHPTGDGAAVA
jgi:hypothetical protein